MAAATRTHRFVLPPRLPAKLMSLDSCEVLLSSTEELLRVLDRGYVGGSDSADGLSRVVSCPRLRPRAELPLLYASDGSLHRGRAATAAYGHVRLQHDDGRRGRQTSSRDSFSEGVPKRRSFAQRAVLAATASPGPACAEPAAPAPKVASKGFGGVGRRRWSVVSDNKDSKISAFNKLASRKKQQEAESMIKQMAQEGIAKRKMLFASLTKQMEDDCVDVPQAPRRSHRCAPSSSPIEWHPSPAYPEPSAPLLLHPPDWKFVLFPARQYAAGRQLPSCYTASHDMDALEEARQPGGLIARAFEIKALQVPTVRRTLPVRAAFVSNLLARRFSLPPLVILSPAPSRFFSTRAPCRRVVAPAADSANQRSVVQAWAAGSAGPCG